MISASTVIEKCTFQDFSQKNALVIKGGVPPYMKFT